MLCRGDTWQRENTAVKNRESLQRLPVTRASKYFFIQKLCLDSQEYEYLEYSQV